MTSRLANRRVQALRSTMAVAAQHAVNNADAFMAERAKRLKRECKGRPNAGMCMGHTQ